MRFLAFFLFKTPNWQTPFGEIFRFHEDTHELLCHGVSVVVDYADTISA